MKDCEEGSAHGRNLAAAAVAFKARKSLIVLALALTIRLYYGWQNPKDLAGFHSSFLPDDGTTHHDGFSLRMRGDYLFTSEHIYLRSNWSDRTSPLLVSLAL
jgi:hypothetical protein